MFVLEAKLYGRPGQYRAIDEAIRTAQFIRNKALRYWMDNWGVQKRDLNKLCRTLAQEHEVARQLDAQARQGAAEPPGLLSRGSTTTAASRCQEDTRSSKRTVARSHTNRPGGSSRPVANT